MGLVGEDDIQHLESFYHTHLAPIVALWLMEVRLAMMSIDLDAGFGDSELHDGIPAMYVDSYAIYCYAEIVCRESLGQLSNALQAIANLLGLTSTCDTISNLRLPSGKQEMAESRDWLLQVASNPDTSLVACQLQGRPCRLLLNWLYHVGRFFKLR